MLSLPGLTKAKGAEQKQKTVSEDSRIPKKPKKAGWTEKHWMLCKKHGDTHKTHNTRDCRCYNKDGTPIKKNGGTGKSHSKERKPEGVNFAQIFRTELRKALRKKSSKHKRHHDKDSESDSNSDNSSWRRGSDSTGKLHTCKKRKLNTAVNSYTTPSPYKAIQTNKSQKNNTIKLTVKKDKTLKNLVPKQIRLN